MRLKKEEISFIISDLENVFKERKISYKGSKLYLYGSRTQDELKGGDIDLLLQVPRKYLVSTRDLKSLFSVRIQSHIGEQRIDFTIKPIETKKDPFTELILEKAILLKSW